MASTTKISLREDGPLVVSSPPNLRDADSKDVETKDVAALCRCGASKNKPFCDGSHSNAGFSSAPDHSEIRNKEIKYSGTASSHPVSVH